MYEVLLKEEFASDYYTCKNEVGQILRIKFEDDVREKHIFHFVTFQIGKRKKGYQYRKQTGKDGIKSLLWAKKCIKDYISYIRIKRDSSYYPVDRVLKHTIVICWDDNKRRDVYYWGLKSLRFYYGMYDGRKALMYDIK